ncbi:ATP-binding protein [Deinococcus ruber]|uniref:ATP-binding protein n=1 Tax=Deinococcus ruber TaxID=1848197 RepID=UPI00166E83D8|nr:ATP-binding protein [Deinococcus ruber]
MRSWHRPIWNALSSGLGLAIVRTLVEAQGGTVVAANHPQGGAVLSVWLPAAAPEA